MIIQHNIAALNSHRQLSINNSSTSKNLEKLSSGYRINRAGDDAAGLAISEKMRGQIRGLAKAEENTSHAINLIQTAEGGLQETHAILQRMRELAVQSANGTYDNPNDRANLQREFERLTEEIDRISVATDYNGIKLLDGSQGVDALTAKFGISVSTVRPGSAAVTQIAQGDSFTITIDKDSSGVLTASLGGIPMTTGGATTASDVDDTTIGTGTMVVTLENGTATEEIEFDINFDVSDLQNGESITITINGTGNNEISVGRVDYLKANGNNEVTGLTFQIGANGTADQHMLLRIEDMGAFALGITDTKYEVNTTAGTDNRANIDMLINIAHQDDANAAIEVINTAINTVSAQRAELGAAQNRLEHTLNNLGVTKENLTSAESTIRDVDMAKEMMEYTKNSILVQASQAMLAQAQSLPQGVLQLLR